ncbi:MAG: AraC family transcriptional regulator [Spirochaetaceae bacterium]|jgi:AraC-like DNA-binding protein|nr:AraC family transcriptional regulator [Spirochaetaceae bacterium]
MDRSLRLLEELVQAFGVWMRCYGADLAGLEDFDDGLRSRVFQKNDVRAIADFIRNMEEGVLHICGDLYGCRYCFFRFPPPPPPHNIVETIFTAGIIGPWQEKNPEEDDISAVCERLNIPAHLRSEVSIYLNAVPPINFPHSWERLLSTGISYLYGGETPLRISRHEPTMDGPPPPEAYSPKPDAALTQELIKKRYDNETILLDAVTEGDVDKAFRCMVGLKEPRSDLWTADKLRNGKNYVIVMDTLLRKAVEKGCVHPAHIDATSAYFARHIESAASQSDLRRIAESMIRRYCALVRKFSLRGYSSLIRNVINMVDFNLQEPLSLSSLAKHFNVNRCNLSAQFKCEKGITLTDYINTKRMEHAASLFRSSGNYIQEVAEQCGFMDTNYFSRLFKRHFGLSPREFLKKNNGG